MASRKTRLLVLTLFISLCGEVCFSSILTKFTRFYPDDPLQRKDVAFVYVTMGCGLGRIFDVKETGFFRRETIGGELLPGYYELCVSFSTESQYSVDCSVLACNLLPGHVYVIAPAASRIASSWYPVLWDVTTSAGRLAFERQIGVSASYDSKKIDEYFTSRREECKIAKAVVERKEARSAELGELEKVWRTIRSGNVIDILVGGKHTIAVVETVSETALTYHLQNDDISYSVAKLQHATVAILATSVEEYDKSGR